MYNIKMVQNDFNIKYSVSGDGLDTPILLLHVHVYINAQKKREEKVSPSTKVYELKFKASILPANPKTCYTPMAHCISLALGAVSLATLHDCYRMIQLIMRGVVKRSVHDGHCVCD